MDNDPDFMMSLARGLTVLESFAEHRVPMTIAQASQRTGLSRSAVRRCLHTLTQLGYAAQDGAQFTLRPKTLSLGFAYLSSNGLAAAAQPLLDRTRDILGESCSLGVREGDDVCYVGRSATIGIMSIALSVGSRLPLYCTSMGRVLLAASPPDERQAYIDRADLTARTDRTHTDRGALLDLIETVAAEGFALIDQELEVGLRSIAVPVRGRHGGVIGAINIGTSSARVSAAELRSRHLPELRGAARELSLLGI
ncbi:MAG: IclR family transcriptional regulator [Rhizorhabdus sp.]|nr:IclR family transcriptional regulator [Rhizorhabdus sp.]